MAKKKVSKETKQQSHDEKSLEQGPKNEVLTRQSFIEDPVEKHQNLKSLNARLLKEMMEMRQQIKSLDKEKETLETELTRVGTETTMEQTRASEEKLMLELEKEFFWVLVEGLNRERVAVVDGLMKGRYESESLLKSEVDDLISELGNERDRLSLVLRERDSIRVTLDIQGEEVVRLEKKNEILEEQAGKLKVENADLMEVKKKLEVSVEDVNRDKDNLEREMDGLKRDIKALEMEKKETERAKYMHMEKINELEIELGQQNEIVLNLMKEDNALRQRVTKLDKDCGEAMKREKDMSTEICALVKQKTRMETELEKVNNEKNSILKKLEMAVEESKEKEKLIDALSQKKSGLEELIGHKETEIDQLNKKVDGLRNVELALKKDCLDLNERNRELVNEIGNVRGALTRIELEKDIAEKELDEEKRNGLNLRSTVSELKMKIKESYEELEKNRNEHERAKSDFENQSESLRNEKAMLEKNLIEANEAISLSAERALALLKDTTSLICQSENAKEDRFMDGQKSGKDMEAFAAELETIKNAYWNNVERVEDMKKEVERAHRKNFWTVISTAIAAVSVAFVARVG